ncbi:PD-(D/E)XK nuclease family protein [Psychrobacter sp. JCM 18903]|uniref:PDDEXK-like family protein n=2 Tax=Psychrobacter sp. JCM 18903 TaxID=1298610 RepID=UPI00191B1DF1|nr:PD-(D/E)XK nuclease family protein [Psychrobacter sp. JCM 18903]
MSAFQTLINEVSQKIHALETAQALYSRQLSPDFNIFDYINTDELGLSRILAFLLDPQGNHAQQETFLKLFIEHCLPDMYEVSERQIFLNNIEKTEVFLEEVTGKNNSLRRMDIYLRCMVGNDSYGICIENKPYAADQFEQLKDYAEELEKRRHKAWHLVYLNEANEGPSEYSIDTSKLEALKSKRQYSHLRFSDLIPWLKACQIECQNHSVNEFLTQLIKFIQKQFMGIKDMNEDNAVLEIMKQSESNLDASLKIYRNVQKMRIELIQKLKTDLILKCQDREYTLDFDNIGKGKNCEYFGFRMKDDPIGFISLEFATDFNNPVLGIRFYTEEDTKDPDNQPYAIEVKRVFNHQFTNNKIVSNKWWPAYYEFQPFDWKSAGRPWYQIETGAMASKVLEEVDVIYCMLKAGSSFHIKDK